MWNQVVAFISLVGSSYIVVDVYVMPHIINWGALECCKKRWKVFSALLMRMVVNWRFAIQQTSTIITLCVLFVVSGKRDSWQTIHDEKFLKRRCLISSGNNLLLPKYSFPLILKAISSKIFTQNLNSDAGSELHTYATKAHESRTLKINKQKSKWVSFWKFLGFLE